MIALRAMTRPLTLSALALAALALASSGNAAPRQTAAQKAETARVARGQAFAQERCSACHGIGANATSPNPESPPFEAVANQHGLTRATLRTFLRDSHNFPEAMQFKVERRHIDDLAAYMITLRKPGYKPEI